MATILRVNNLRIVVYSNDHAPPHCHIVSPDGEAKVSLTDDGGSPKLVSNYGLSRRQLRRALAVIRREQGLVLQRWRELHGEG